MKICANDSRQHTFPYSLELINFEKRRKKKKGSFGFVSNSQAAILQQTAQYIITLEREKTTLLNQVCHLKRVVDQHDGAVVEVVQSAAAAQQQTGASTQAPNLKKRKLDTIYTMQAISDSSDEGLGSMSPEPTVLTSQTSSAIITKQVPAAGNVKEFIDLKNMLENERRKNSALEERLRQFAEKSIYTGSSNENGTVTYQHELIEHADNVRSDDDENNIRTIVIGGGGGGGSEKIHHGNQNVQVLSLDTIPHAGQTRVVMCSQLDDEVDMLDGINHAEAYDEDDSRTMSPYMETAALLKEEVIIDDHRPQSPNICVLETIRSTSSPHDSHLMQTGNATNSNIRLQPILEAVIKADPKVEVERINSPSSITVIKDVSTDAQGAPTTQTNSNANRSSRMYITHNTSRQNLETIVEAIRHLEGDQLFGEMIEPTQEVPLALTNKPQRQLQMEMDSFLQFRAQPTAAVQPTSQIPLQQQQHQHQQPQQHSPLLQAQLQHTKCANTTIRTAAVPVAKSSPSTTIIMHSQHLQQNHAINNRPGVIVVKQNSWVHKINGKAENYNSKFSIKKKFKNNYRNI